MLDIRKMKENINGSSSVRAEKIIFF